MDYISDIRFEKIKKWVRVSNVYIAPIITVSDVKIEFSSDIQMIFGRCNLNCQGAKSYRAVYKKRNIYGETLFIDLETGMIYSDESEINPTSGSKKYIQTSEIIPMSRFFTKKYKYKVYDVHYILELASDIISDIKDITNEDEVENLDYNNFFITPIYKYNNIIKDKALVYQYGDVVIDLDSKEIYSILDNSKRQVSGDYVIKSELIPIKEFLANVKTNRSKILTKKNN